MAEIKSKGKQGIGRLVIFGLLAVLAGIIIFRYFSTNPGGMLGPPAEYSVRYMPSEYEMDLGMDEEDALAILQNPQRYRREFNQLVYDINVDILRHVSRRMGLTDSVQSAVLSAYDKQHPLIRNLYYNDFIALQDSTDSLYETWYEKGSSNATSVLREIASKYTCFLVNELLATVIKTTGDGSIFAKGKKLDTPCGIAMNEVLQPMIERLADKAAIDDFGRARGLLQERVEKVIGELATMEVRDKKGINKKTQTKIWGFNVSETDVEITAISDLKVGFRLTDYFDVELNESNKTVVVTLPEPAILSHEVYPKIEKMDVGWLREIEKESLNDGINALRSEFRRDAMQSDIMDKAKVQAEDLMTTMFGPLVASMNGKYKLKVNFRTGSSPPLEDDQTALDQR